MSTWGEDVNATCGRMKKGMNFCKEDIKKTQKNPKKTML
jgi:hypothetical protein